MSKWRNHDAAMKKGALANPENPQKMKMQQKREVNSDNKNQVRQ
jgi:hypothetical protein